MKDLDEGKIQPDKIVDDLHSTEDWEAGEKTHCAANKA